MSAGISELTANVPSADAGAAGAAGGGAGLLEFASGSGAGAGGLLAVAGLVSGTDGGGDTGTGTTLFGWVFVDDVIATGCGSGGIGVRAGSSTEGVCAVDGTSDSAECEASAGVAVP